MTCSCTAAVMCRHTRPFSNPSLLERRVFACILLSCTHDTPSAISTSADAADGEVWQNLAHPYLFFCLLLSCCPAEDLLARAANDPEVEQQLIKRMRSLLAPFVLRRLKSELAEQMVTKNHKLHEVSYMLGCQCLCMTGIQSQQGSLQAVGMHMVYCSLRNVPY